MAPSFSKHPLHLLTYLIFSLTQYTLATFDAHFIYPDATSSSTFKAGDKVLVKYEAKFDHPQVAIGCSNHDKTNLTNSPNVKGNGSVLAELNFGAQNQCFFELFNAVKSVLSVPFSISAANGSGSLHSSSSPSSSPSLPSSSNTAGTQKRDISRPSHIQSLRQPRLSHSSLARRASNATSNATASLSPTSNRLMISLPGDDSATFVTVHGTNCTDPRKPAYPECWSVLKIDDWLTAWREQMQPCEDDNDSDSCIMSDEVWTQTFLRMYFDGDALENCYDITPSLCTAKDDKTIGASDPLLSSARYSYVRQSIILVGLFFNSWAVALSKAMGQAADLVRAIIDVVDPPKKMNALVNILMSILSFGLMFIPGAGEVVNWIGDLTVQTIENLETGLKAIPSAVKEIWPKKTDNDQQIQADALVTKFQDPDGINDQIMGRLGKLLHIIQGENATLGVQPFLSFAGKGDFAVRTEKMPIVSTADPDGGHTRILQAFTTFLSTTGLQHNKWKVLAIPGLDMQAYQHAPKDAKPCPAWAKGKCKSKDVHWCDTYDEYGLCDYWWYSKEHNSMYTIVKDEELVDEATDMLKQIFSHKWTTGPTLFENAAVCEYLTLFAPSANATYAPSSNSTSPPTAGSIIYLNAQAGGWDGSVIDSVATTLNSTHNFIPLDGGALGTLAKRDDYDKKFDRPDAGNAPLGVVPDSAQDTGDGGIFDCVSQMPVIVATAWKEKNWREGSGKA